MKYSKANNISLDILNRLADLFIQKGWDFKNNYKCKAIYDRFGLMLKELNTQQQELILFLTEDFFYCPLERYPSLLLSALKKIHKSFIERNTNIFILPLVNENEGGTSGSSVLPLICKTEVIPFIPNFQGKPVYYYQNIQQFYEQNINRGDTLILLLDDFIGSGKTVCDAINDYEGQGYFKQSDDIFIISIAAQKNAISKIEDEIPSRYRIITGELRTKGISDCSRFPHSIFANPQDALDIMGELEDSLGVTEGNDHRFGYRRCESLVSFMNTPDNTFPVFRIAKKRNGNKWNAPFLRV